MPPKSSTTKAPRGRPAGSNTKTASTPTTASKKPSAAAKGKQRAQPSESPEPRGRGEDEEQDNSDEPMEEAGVDDDDDEEPEKTIPPELLTRILHEFFEKDGTRITKDANSAVAKYMDIFVKEAIARAAAERDGGFFEVEDLEKIAPQLLFDL
ncbi:Centromere protein X [Cytospora mali]|uniref:Centromere protein X n=1 Tax=Cytospora mali TaxID=578113 RepID=A0A194VEW3_CYTMA|nr:Centromere protein X [Valsa mali var. pyri (nom. inval.)]